jgi:hypothetical protein
VRDKQWRASSNIVCAKHRKQDEVAGFVKLGIADDNRGRASPLGVLATPTPTVDGPPASRVE